jgi:hypothetical protein
MFRNWWKPINKKLSGPLKRRGFFVFEAIIILVIPKKPAMGTIIGAEKRAGMFPGLT